MSVRRAGTGGRRRAFATLVVLLVVAIASATIVVLQTTTYAQASAGREAMARVRATWAARAGVEAVIARLAHDVRNPVRGDALAIYDSLAEVSRGRLDGAEYRVSHSHRGQIYAGPADAHARHNINRLPVQGLILLPFMTEDVASAIADWIDADDDTRPLGAELGYYQSLAYPYLPRNGPMRSLEELELVAWVYPDFVRGEDWNLNRLLDPNENDGDASFPPDNRDGQLDGGWSELLTTESVGDVLGASGEPRLDLRSASAGDIASTLGVSNRQAEAIAGYMAGASSTPQLTDFLRQSLQQLYQSVQPPGSGGGGGGRGGGGQQQPQIEGLSDEQLALLLEECTTGMEDPAFRVPGKLNINTADRELLDYIPGLSPALADALILERDARSQGFTRIVELLQVPGMNRRRLADVYEYLTVRSNTFVVTSRGRDERTGVEVELVVTVDRATLPVVIRDLLVR